MTRASIVWLVAGACASAHVSSGDDDGDDDDGVEIDAAIGPVEDAAEARAPALDELVFDCKLINDRNLDDPTANNTHQRVNLRGTDLGIPVAHGNDIYFLFGDTAGAQVIWPLGPESLPDAVGYSAVSASAVASDPRQLCTQLRFLHVTQHSGTADADFAGTWMTPPSGHAISEYIHNPSGPRGENAFPNMPGDYEVPTGAFSYAGSIYVFYTIVSTNPLEMRGSYLATWATPSTSGLPTYDILYHVDERFDANGALRGDFINIAPVVDGQYVYLFGTGRYRQSSVHLVRKRLTTLATAGSFERFDASSRTWVSSTATAAPVVANALIGELSVRYFATIDRWVMMDQEVQNGNRIVARFADAPEGPWSEPITVAMMSDPSFVASYCCNGTDCPGERMMECEHAAFYAPYMLPTAATNADGSFSISFLMSTHIPYNVALMTATFR